MQPDHLWLQEIGGVHIPGNVVPSCPTCNSERGNKPWNDYLKKKYLSSNRNGVEKQIEKIERYMNYYKVNEKPTIEAYLTKEEIELRENLNEILFALSEGIRSKVGNPQKRDIKFIKPGKMFDEIVETIYKYKINKAGGNSG